MNDILKRLAHLEAVHRKSAPDLVFMWPDEDGAGWSVKEVYCKRTVNGEVIKGGHEALKHVQRRSDYRPPEGFKGVVFIEDRLED